MVVVLGGAQVLAWASSYYLPAVLSTTIARDTGWSLEWVVGGFSIGVLVSGLVSPLVGNAIEAMGGRPVLAASAVMIAAGLLILAVAGGLWMYCAGWVVLGVGMGAGLYDPAFAALGRLYGSDARRLITGVTLLGGFASTVCWPLSAWLMARFGWRGTCVAYAAVSLFATLPLYLVGLPREARRGPAPVAVAASPARAGRSPALLLAVLALVLTIISIISAVMSVQLLAVLQAEGVALGTAVTLGALLGPCQVGARLIDLMVGRRLHATWSMLVCVALVALGLVAMRRFGTAGAAVGVVLYGAGIGLRSILRGTLPLALFGQAGYAQLIGQLALPTLVVQAGAPLASAFLLAHGGAGLVLATLLACAALAGAGTVALVVFRPRD